MSSVAPKFTRLKTPLSTPPMEARAVDAIPVDKGWQYEPKWDGFRCLLFRDGDSVALMSKSGKPLARYFPEVVAQLATCKMERFALDAELVLPIGISLSFAALQARLHPAPARIAKLSKETPAELVLFDCLETDAGVWLDQSLDSRRTELERFASNAPGMRLSPVTYSPETARAWLERSGGALDGIMAKRRSECYHPGKRSMFKHKVRRTADCVVGGFRFDRAGSKIASLLLGLYDENGLLSYVGHTSAFSADQRDLLVPILEPLKGSSAFTGSAPGGPSRWSAGSNTEWIALKAELVVEVTYDQVTGGRFRHGTTFVRWRPDKAPSQCTNHQLTAELQPEQLEQLFRNQDPSAETNS